jgi:hypothetical protein
MWGVRKCYKDVTGEEESVTMRSKGIALTFIQIRDTKYGKNKTTVRKNKKKSKYALFHGRAVDVHALLAVDGEVLEGRVGEEGFGLRVEDESVNNSTKARGHKSAVVM